MASREEHPLIHYEPLTVWSLIRKTAINLILPFINGMMAGFGELFAHEAAFRLGWGGTRVFPPFRRRVNPIGLGVEIRGKLRARPGDMDDMVGLEW